MVIVGGKELSPDLLVELQRQGQELSRGKLARVLCERLSWTGPSGKAQLMNARKALAELNRAGELQLPVPEFKWPRATPVEPLPEPLQPLRQSLEALGTVRLVLVGSRKSKAAQQWKQIMAHHYLGPGPLCGAQLRYVVESDHQVLGALAFSAAALKCQERDDSIGWSQDSRRHHLYLVVNNSRFVILPWVKVPDLGSHILALATDRLAGDWQQRYDYRPVLLESFVDSARFEGKCYQAAGWQCVGQSRGRGRGDREHAHGRSIKSIWLKALQPDWKEQLTKTPEVRRFACPAPAPAQIAASPEDWAEEELGAAELGDSRLSRRLLVLLRDFFARPLAQLPEACGSWAKTKAAYRFFDHDMVKMEKILAPHREQTAQRVSEHKVVLAVQDTTELDYTAHPDTSGLGPIGNHRAHVQGLLLHPTMVYSLEGVPLGLIQAQCWTRDAADDSKDPKKFRRSVEQKESVKWLKSFAAAKALQEHSAGTMVVSVGDCEADMFELYAEAAKDPAKTKFLVRAYRSRNVEGNEELWKKVSQKPAAGEVEVCLPRRQDKPARKATLTVRFDEVKVQPPDYMKKSEPVSMWAVVLIEENPPEGTEEPVEWLLLTNVPVRTLEEAVEMTRWYGQRFQIEVYFRTLKSGCRMEDRQLGTGSRLENCLAIDLVVAWRVNHLVKLGRETPDVPCTVFFEEMQWKVLVARRNSSPEALQTPPSLGEALLEVARIGGFLARKSDGAPGAQTIWRGLQRLDDQVAGFELALGISRPVSSTTDYG